MTELTASQKWIPGLALSIRLLDDRRVDMLPKLIFAACVAYAVIPGISAWITLDFLPGPIDNAAVLMVGWRVFLELCPPKVVRELVENENL